MIMIIHVLHHNLMNTAEHSMTVLVFTYPTIANLNLGEN